MWLFGSKASPDTDLHLQIQILQNIVEKNHREILQLLSPQPKVPPLMEGRYQSSISHIGDKYVCTICDFEGLSEEDLPKHMEHKYTYPIPNPMMNPICEPPDLLEELKGKLQMMRQKMGASHGF